MDLNISMEVKCWFCDGKGGDFEHYISRSHNDMDWNNCELCNGTGKIDIPEEIIMKISEEEKDKIFKGIDKLENPMPKDIFKWNNLEELNFNRGRFNKHCFEIWENFRRRLKQKLVEG